MKKVLGVMLALLMVPAMCWGFGEMNNQEMGDVTGQAGVQIAVDDVEMFQKIEGLYYKDTDGLDTNTGDAAAVGIKQMTAHVQVNAIGSSNHTMGSTSVSDWTLQKAGTTERKPLTIDVSSNLPILTAAEGSPVAGVRIGLPTVEIVQSATTLDIGVDTDLSDSTHNSFGEIHLGKTTMAITDGVVEIAPH